jgi:hypothetical protein
MPKNAKANTEPANVSMASFQLTVQTQDRGLQWRRVGERKLDDVVARFLQQLRRAGVLFDLLSLAAILFLFPRKSLLLLLLL